MVDLITLVRNHHSGIRQADKLEPFIKEADVVSMEEGFCSQTTAKLVQGAFNKLFSSKDYQKLRQTGDKGTNESYYNLRLFDLLKKHKKKVVLAEKYSDPELAEIRSFYKALQQQVPRQQLDSFDDFIHAYYDYEVLFRETALTRRNDAILDHLPATLKEVHSVRRGAKHYVIILGRSHDIADRFHIESEIPVRDVYLSKSPYEHLRPKTHLSVILSNKEGAEKAGLYIAQQEAADLLFKLLRDDLSFFEYVRSVHGNYIASNNGNNLQERDQRVAEKLESDIFLPVANYLASQLTYEDLKKMYLKLFEQGTVFFNGNSIDLNEHHSQEEVDRAVVSLLADKGVQLPFGTHNSKQWDAFFPYNQKGSEEPVVRMFTL